MFSVMQWSDVAGGGRLADMRSQPHGLSGGRSINNDFNAALFVRRRRTFAQALVAVQEPVLLSQSAAPMRGAHVQISARILGLILQRAVEGLPVAFSLDRV
jgi:hypothetical protein